MEYISRKKRPDIHREQELWEETHNNLIEAQQARVQKKSLEISNPGDADEKEADEVARKVSSGESAEIHGSGSAINRKGEGTTETTPEFQSRLESSKGGGQSLDDSTRSEMESKMGADFSGVKIHTGGEASRMSESINAKAFTYGQDIYFSNNSSPQNKELLAHELVHTVQQRGSVQRKIQRQADDKVSYNVKFPPENEIPEYVKDQRTVNIYIYNLIFGLSEQDLIAAGVNLNAGWTPIPLNTRSSIAGKSYILQFPRSEIDKLTQSNPEAAKQSEGKNVSSGRMDSYYGGLSHDEQVKITEEADRLFREQTGVDRQLTQNDEDAYYRQLWKDIRAGLLEKRKKVMELPQRTKDFLFAGGKSIEPVDYDQILEAAEIIKRLNDEDLIRLKKIGSGGTGEIGLVTKNLNLYVESIPWVLRMYEAMDEGLLGGTDEQAVYRVLNNRPELVVMINASYNARYYPDDSGSMVDDIDGDMDGWSWEFAKVLLAKAGIPVVGEETPQYTSTPGNIYSPDGKGIYCSNPFKTVLQPGDSIWYAMHGVFETYEWGILYESGSVLVPWDESSSYVPATEEQVDGGNQFTVKWQDFEFSGVHTILCRVTDTGGKVYYYAYPQEVRGPEEKISTREVQYELIAHDMAYRNYLGSGSKVSDALTGEELMDAKLDFARSKIDLDLLKSWGYDSNLILEDHENDPGNGFFAMLILPLANRKDLNPIIAFRGTSNTPDFITDSDVEGPGWTQYQKNKANIQKLIDDANRKAPGKKIDLTGHSLGGALAQWTATDESFKGKFERVITFQSPAINRQRVEAYKLWDVADRPSTVIHHIVFDDIVPFAGEASIPGTFYTHKTQEMAPLLSHTHLILQSEAYAKQREELGLTDKLLEVLGWSGSNLPTQRNKVLETSDFPFPEARADVEYARKVARLSIEQAGKEIEELGNRIEEAQRQLNDALVRQLMAQKAALELYLKLLTFTFP